MTWITILWPNGNRRLRHDGAASLANRAPPGAAHLLFSLNAFVVMVFSCLELASTRAGSLAQSLELQCWLDIPGAV